MYPHIIDLTRPNGRLLKCIHLIITENHCLLDIDENLTEDFNE